MAGSMDDTTTSTDTSAVHRGVAAARRRCATFYARARLGFWPPLWRFVLEMCWSQLTFVDGCLVPGLGGGGRGEVGHDRHFRWSASDTWCALDARVFRRGMRGHYRGFLGENFSVLLGFEGSPCIQAHHGMSLAAYHDCLTLTLVSCPGHLAFDSSFVVSVDACNTA